MKVSTIKMSKKNLSKNLSLVKELCLKDGDLDLILYFSKGRYSFDEILSLDVSGYKGKKHIRLIGDESGNTGLTSSVSFKASDFTVDGNFAYINVPKNEDGKYPEFCTFYVNGKMQLLASSKVYNVSNQFLMPDGTLASPGFGKWPTPQKFYLPHSVIEETALDKHTGIEIHLWVEWVYKIYHLGGVDLNDTFVDNEGTRHTAIYIDKNEEFTCNAGLSVCGRRITICNALSVLSNGGYVYDNKNGKLYIRKQDLKENKRYSIGKDSGVLDFIGFESVTLNSLSFYEINDFIRERVTFWNGGQAGGTSQEAVKGFPYSGIVKGKNLNGLNVTRCVFRDVPCGALTIDGKNKNINITESIFQNIGGSAIRLTHEGGKPESPIFNENINIYNNYIKNTGIVYSECCAITVTKARNLRISYNTILSSAYTAISVGWRWTRIKHDYNEQVNLINADISHNYIKSFMTNMLDGGAIYMLGSNADMYYTGSINFVHDNYIVEDEYTCPENKFFSCLYHDGSSSNWNDHDNVVVHNRKIDGYSARMFVQYYYPQLEMFNIGTEYAQNAWNIFIKNNHYINCHRLEEVYQVNLAHVMIDETRNIFDENLKMYKNMREALKNKVVKNIIAGAGCLFKK